MQVVSLELPGLKLVKPQVFRDRRGMFVETYQAQRYADVGIGDLFPQDNHSVSATGTLRGLHFQARPGQAKLVRVGLGKIYDVAVDIRPGSPTFRRWVAVELDGEAHHQLFVPVGFAHGFVVTEGPAHVIYRVSSPYDPDSERQIAWNDQELAIPWPCARPELSPRDQAAPPLCQVPLA